MSNEQSGSENIKCIVRCRPLNEKEKGLGTKCITISADSKVVIVENKNDKLSNGKYAMDRVFPEDVTQEEVFQEIGEPIIQSFLGGYNCTIFCYGQTGAGKTHTMMGPLDQLYETNSSSHGLIPRIINYIFNDKEKVNNIITGGNTAKCKNIKINTKICVMELYQESIIDLLSKPDSKDLKTDKNDKNNELKIKEDPKKGMFVQGITEVEVNNAKEAKDLILTGLKSRHVAATEMNAESSRSHLLFSIYVTTSYMNPRGGAVSKSSRLHLIDLAGSERQKKTKAQGERIKEACMINKSLSTLGNVINALVENYEGKNKYIPFRDSKLTYFLKDSLGGNSKTTIVANISCSLIQMNETISTLKFVQRAKMIKNSATLNMSVQENIEALQEEIKKLKAIIAKGGQYIDGENQKVNNKVNDNYICPICHNQPIEINQEKIMQNYKNEIMQLTELIIKNFKSEENVKKQFQNLDKEIISSGFQFYSLVDKYKNDYGKKLNDLNELINAFKTFYNGIKDNLDKANQKVISFKLGDAMDRITFAKINELNIQATNLMNKFEKCNMENFKKLEEENETLKVEKNVSDEMKKILENKKRLELEQKEINPNSKNIKESVDKYINSNDKIIKFFSENFLNKSSFKDELVLLEKTKYDMLIFQLDEAKMTEKSLKKQIEQMETDNYLINIDILRMKSQLDAYKSKNKKYVKNEIKEEKNEENELNISKNSIKSKDSIESFKLCKDSDKSFESNDENDIDDDIQPIRMSVRSAARKGIMRVENVDPSIRAMKTAKNLSSKIALNVDNLEIVRMKERLDEMNDDLSQKITENQDLKQEVYELNNKINSLNIKIQESEDNIKELNQQIEVLDATNEAFEKNIEELSNYKKEMSSEIEELIKNKNDEENRVNELIKMTDEINEKYKNKCEELFNKNKELIVKNEIKDKIIDLNNNEINEIMIVINNNNDNTNLLFNNMNEIIKNLMIKLNLKEKNINQLKNENQNIINEKEDMDNKNKDTIKSLENDINNYKNKIISKDKIIQTHIEQELYINMEFEEINKLISLNNLNVNQLNSIYEQDLSSFKKYYNNIVLFQKKSILKFLSENDANLDESKEMIKKNSNLLEDLSSNYNQFNNMYFDKCCSLLNAVNVGEMKNKFLEEKNKNNEIKENSLNQKLSLLEKENANLKNENKSIKQSSQINLEDNMKLKKDLEKSKTQINTLNNEIIKFIEQIKEKDNLLDSLRKEQSKINLQINELENKNKSLDLNISEKNNLIKNLQTEADKQNKVIDELNNKNISLIKEIEEEKNNHSLYKDQNADSGDQISQLNDKILMLFNEISNKDKTINQLNNEHSELSKQINEMVNHKNENLNKINEKEKEIITLQNNINELNNKFLENNRQINNMVNESKNKINEIEGLKKNLNESQKDTEEKDTLIKMLNNKIRMLEDFNKKNLLKNKNNNISLSNNLDVNNEENDGKSLNGLKEIYINGNGGDNWINNNGNELIIQTLKNKNEELIKEKIQKDNESNKLNMKYSVTEILSNLFLQLIKEFNIYKEKIKDNKNSPLLNETFIKEKINQCNNEKKILENNISSKMASKKNILNDLYGNISTYTKQYDKEIDTFINNLNVFLDKLKEDEKELKLSEITENLIEDLNQLSLNNISNKDKNKEIIDLLNEMNKLIQYKIKLVDTIFKIINESYNNTIVLEELNCDENILYYECKNLNNIANKNKKIVGGGGQNENEKLFHQWTEFKKIIINSKRKYNEILNKFISYKKTINTKKNLLKQNSLYLCNIMENGSNNENNDQKQEEINNDMKFILNKIENNKNSLHQLINHYNDNINGNELNNNYKLCQNSVPNLSKMKNIIIENDKLKEEIEQKLNEMKTNYLLLKTLSSNYESYTKYLSLAIIEQKNKILENKMKIIFGENFDLNKLYNAESKPEVIWNQKEIPRITTEIMILRENKNNLENDLNALNLAFNLALKGNPTLNENQLVILFKIKEENKLLKKEIKKIKEKNNALQEKIKKIVDENIKDKSNNKTEIELYDNIFTLNLNTSENNNSFIKGNNNLNTLGDCSSSENKETNKGIKKTDIKPKNIFNESKDNSIANDISNGFTPKLSKKKNIIVDKK